MKGGYVEPEYVQAMLDREKLTPTYLGESIAVPHGTVEAKDRVLKTGVVFCQYPEGVRFGEEDDIARLVIGIAARNNEHIQVITSLTNALDDESVIERLAHTTSVDEVLELLAGRGNPFPPSPHEEGGANCLMRFAYQAYNIKAQFVLSVG